MAPRPITGKKYEIPLVIPNEFPPRTWAVQAHVHDRLHNARRNVYTPPLFVTLFSLYLLSFLFLNFKPFFKFSVTPLSIFFPRSFHFLNFNNQAKGGSKKLLKFSGNNCRKSNLYRIFNKNTTRSISSIITQNRSRNKFASICLSKYQTRSGLSARY